MSATKYSQEEIERKRQEAVQRKKDAQLKITKPTDFHDIRNNKRAEFNKNKFIETPRNKYVLSVQRHVSQGNSGNVIRTHKPNERFNPIKSQAFYGKNTNVTGKTYMISENRFAVETSLFIPAVIEIFKTVPSKLYDAKSRIWNFHLKDYEDLMGKLIQSQSHIEIVGLPRTVLKIFRQIDSRSIPLDTDLSKIDTKLVQSLMPFQREGICYGISKHGRCMIADDMGLGKTIQALGIAYYFKENWPLLIVTPSSIRYQWSEAIYNFLPSIPAQYVQQFANAKDFIDSDSIVIVSYDMLVRAKDTFQKHNFGFVILDESHCLKSSKTARFQAVRQVTSRAKRVILLTGTPVLSRPIELHSQISLIMPNFIGYQEYGIRYCAGEKNAFGWDFTGSSNMLELQILLKTACMIRRLKNDVLHQLPSKIRQIIMLDPALIKASTKEMAEMAKVLQKKVLNGAERHNALIHYYNESSIAKLKAICNYVTDLLENKRKCIIFAHHQNVLDAICNIAESMKIRYIRIDGKTNPECRKHQVDKFQERDDYLVAVLSITAANSGITLTAAQLVVFAELFWNPGILCQAEDRAHRIGQDNSVIIQYLIAKQTADDFLWPLIQRKINIINDAGLDQDFSLAEVNITNQSTHTMGQLTLNTFVNKKREYLPKKDSGVTEEYKQLLDVDEEDFNLCDWDDVT